MKVTMIRWGNRCDHDKTEGVMRQIDPTLLDTETIGLNLKPGTLRDQLGDSYQLLVFLRHFG